MKNRAFEITESELKVMKVLWKCNEPIMLQQVCDALINKKWKYTTISTMLVRLGEKGAVSYDRKGRIKYYYAVVKEEEYKKFETKNLISKLYGGSVKKLAVSLLQGGEMSEDEIEEIKNLIDL